MPEHINPHKPSDADLKKLRLAMPQLKKQLQKGNTKSAKIARQLDTQICGICSVAFDEKNRCQSNTKICLECSGKLYAGETALVAMDGRFIFLMADENPQVQQFRGQIISVTAETMDKLYQKNESKN